MEGVLEQCRCHVVINDDYLRNIDWSAKAPMELDLSVPNALALLIFTSGSTAKPKGVMIEHRNIMAMNDSVSGFALTSEDAVCVFPSFSFVAAISDTFPPLLCGAALYIIDEEFRHDIRQIIDYFIKYGITVSFLPPHMAEKLCRTEDGRTRLRLLIVGSENMRNLSPQRYEIRHVFGSSEMCSLVADYVIRDTRGKYPIGRVKSGMKYYIIGSDGEPVPHGKDGELWLSGPQVSRGYFYDPQKTAKQYLLNPFCSDTGYERVFRTGDIVRQLEDGNLLHISRMDDVFKIRGYRVEAGVVESMIAAYPGVRDVVVRAFPDSNGVNVLYGYFLSQEEVDPKAIKLFLKERIPYYMIPACLIRMKEFPRNLNNKVIRPNFRPPAETCDH